MRLLFTIVTTIICFLLINKAILSQGSPIPNNSFENWSGGEPVGWWTTNEHRPGSVTQSSDAQLGSFSVKLNKVDETPAHTYLNLESQSGFGDAQINAGFPVNKEYTSLKAYTKFMTDPSSLLYWYYITVSLYNSNSFIAGGVTIFQNPPTSEWIEIEVQINYSQQLVPDSAFIAVEFNDTNRTSTAHLLVDNIHFNSLSITRPAAGQKWCAGSMDSIKWDGGDKGDFIQLEFSADSGNTFDLIDNFIAADTGRYDWAIPDTILSTKYYIRIFDMADTTIVDTSDRFSITFCITNPMQGDKWIAGTEDTIKWDGGANSDFVQLEFSADSGSTYELIDNLILADTGLYVWAIPDTILSTKCYISIFNMVDSTITDTSDLFKIKGDVLTKFDADSNYVAFLPSNDGWRFSNNIQANMWPATWWIQFNYITDNDPYTGDPYPRKFWGQLNSTFVDWPLWVETFGENQCYWSTFLGIYKDRAINKWKAENLSWNGSCYGFAGSSFLGFNYKESLISQNPGLPNFTNLASVFLSTTPRNTINSYYIHQDGKAAKDNDVTGKPKRPRETLQELRDLFRNDETDIKTLSFFRPPPGSGAHTVAPYKIQRDTTNPNHLRVYVYDSNNPLIDTMFLIIDSLNNQWQDNMLLNYGTGNNRFYLEIPITKYLSKPILPSGPVNYINKGESFIEFYNPQYANSLYISGSGDSLGYVDSTIINTSDTGFEIIPKSGISQPPLGYYLPLEEYNIQVDNFPDSSSNLFVFTDEIVYVYERFDATEVQSDRFYYNNNFSVSSDDSETKNILLTTIVEVDSSEKVFYLENTTIKQNDSLDLSVQDNDKLTFKNYGSIKDYDLSLKFATSKGGAFFNHISISLPQNTSHQVVPDWSDIVTTPITVLVDNGIDGSIDDTLTLKNQITSVEDQGILYIPKEYRLGQNYPNPFNPTTTISYSIPREGLVTIIIYNAIGEEVTILVNEVKQVGTYDVSFDATALPSGIYFYRLQVGSFVKTKKMVLMK
jgi:hypothetical protein